FLLAGIALGPAGLGLAHVAPESGFNQFVLLLGASWLLFDGGASLRFTVLKEVWITIVTISTLGVLVTAAVVAVAVAALLGVALAFVLQAGVGIGVGAGLGYAVADLVAHEKRGVLADFAPVAALAGVTGAYALASALHGSGFMAVFVFGLMFGNRGSFGLHL